jgi:hypothetical protein
MLGSTLGSTLLECPDELEWYELLELQYEDEPLLEDESPWQSQHPAPCANTQFPSYRRKLHPSRQMETARV